jgi:hypothetical protein
MHATRKIAAAAAVTASAALTAAGLLPAATAAAVLTVPIVTSVTLDEGHAGDAVVVSGSNLTDPAIPALPAIRFGGAAGHVISCAPAPAASCRVIVPPGTGTVQVRVTDGRDGTSARNPPGDQFTYLGARSVLRARYVCGTSQLLYRWRVTDIAGGRTVFANLTAFDERDPGHPPRLLWEGSRHIPYRTAITVITRDGYQLHVFWMPDGTQPPRLEKGALTAIARAPLAGTGTPCR